MRKCSGQRERGGNKRGKQIGNGGKVGKASVFLCAPDPGSPSPSPLALQGEGAKVFAQKLPIDLLETLQEAPRWHLVEQGGAPFTEVSGHRDRAGCCDLHRARGLKRQRRLLDQGMPKQPARPDSSVPRRQTARRRPYLNSFSLFLTRSGMAPPSPFCRSPPRKIALMSPNIIQPSCAHGQAQPPSGASCLCTHTEASPTRPGDRQTSPACVGKGVMVSLSDAPKPIPLEAGQRGILCGGCHSLLAISDCKLHSRELRLALAKTKTASLRP